jgi:hypothetical protein
MLSASPRHLTLLACLLAAPVLGLASSIAVNGTQPTDTLTYGTSTNGTFNFDYVFGDSDKYDIFGDYSATNPILGPTTIQFNVTAVYEGNKTNTNSKNDVLTIDDLQDYIVPYSLDGMYFEDTAADIGGPIASKSSFSAELFFNGHGLGMLGPFVGPGSSFASSSSDLTGLKSPLDAEFQFTFDFAKGSEVGSFISTVPKSAVPEPGGVISTAIILALGLGFPAFRRSRLHSKDRVTIRIPETRESFILNQ